MGLGKSGPLESAPLNHVVVGPVRKKWIPRVLHPFICMFEGIGENLTIYISQTSSLKGSKS